MQTPDRDMQTQPSFKDRRQKRQLDLGRKRFHFSFSNTSQPSLVEDVSVNIDQLQDHLQDPEEFFEACEKQERANKELQRQRGEVSTKSIRYKSSATARSRRPGILGKKFAYKHYPLLAADFDKADSPETFEVDLSQHGVPQEPVVTSDGHVGSVQGAETSRQISGKRKILRRSERTKVAPLKFWRGERLLYGKVQSPAATKNHAEDGHPKLNFVGPGQNNEQEHPPLSSPLENSLAGAETSRQISGKRNFLRRSERTKVAPLKFWLGERLLYGKVQSPAATKNHAEDGHPELNFVGPEQNNEQEHPPVSSPLENSLAGAETSCQISGKRNFFRRSERTKVAALKFWRGERLLYGKVQNEVQLVGYKKWEDPVKGGGISTMKVECLLDGCEELVKELAR